MIGGLLWTRKLNFEPHKMRGSSFVEVKSECALFSDSDMYEVSLHVCTF